MSDQSYYVDIKPFLGPIRSKTTRVLARFVSPVVRSKVECYWPCSGPHEVAGGCEARPLPTGEYPCRIRHRTQYILLQPPLSRD